MGMDDAVFSVSALTSYLDNVISSDPIIGNKLVVQGELSNVKQSARGHVYFTLRDEGAAIGGILWASTARRLKFDLEDGLEVYLTGKLEIYKPSGSYSIVGSKIEPVGVGALQQSFEQLKQKLSAEGLFNDDYKKEIPDFPRRIGIVTSNTGAVIHDMIRTLRAKNPMVDILLCSAKVQGEGAAEEIARAIEELNHESYNLDTLIVGRGGGSFEDLFCFSEEPVVRAVFNSRVPVITGIGHEPDYALADAAADYSAATPTMAAEYAVPDIDELRSHLAWVKEELAHQLGGVLKQSERELDLLATRFVDCVTGYIDAGVQQVDQQQSHLIDNVESYFKTLEKHLSHQADQLEAFSPLKTLSRGYSVASLEDGAVLQTVKQVKAGDSLTVKVSDGMVKTTVQESIKDK